MSKIGVYNSFGDSGKNSIVTCGFYLIIYFKLTLKMGIDSNFINLSQETLKSFFFQINWQTFSKLVIFSQNISKSVIHRPSFPGEGGLYF